MRTVAPLFIFLRARATPPPMSISIGVRVIEYMAAQTVRFLCMHGARTSAASNILRMRHGFEMCWIHARRSAAQMVEFKASWNRTDQGLIGPAMCSHVPATVIDIAIPAVDGTTKPNPAPVGFDLHATPKPRVQRPWCSGVVTLTGTVRRLSRSQHAAAVVAGSFSAGLEAIGKKYGLNLPPKVGKAIQMLPLIVGIFD
jgi:hypothetical protein